MWGTSERFQVVIRIPPLVGYDVIKRRSIDVLPDLLSGDVGVQRGVLHTEWKSRKSIALERGHWNRPI